MAKKLKITEAQFKLFQEFIDKDGSLIDGDAMETDSTIKTNMYRTSGHPETSDDFQAATGQGSNWYWQSRGFSIAESTKKANYYRHKNLREAMESQTTIPAISELSKSYEQPQIQSNLSNLTRSLAQLSEYSEEIKAIVLKEILTAIDISTLNEPHQQEIKRMVSK